MFTSFNNSSSYYYYTTDQPMLDRSVNNDVNPSFKHDQTPLSSFFQFSPPYLDSNSEENIEFLQQRQDLFISDMPQHPHNPTAGDGDGAKNIHDDVEGGRGPISAVGKKNSDHSDSPTPRKRPSKKDRHSKILTAHGPRDRRMRLNIDIAREFFNLQDMLSFDKASKTVGWLLRIAQPAIKELTGNLAQAKRSSSGSEKSVSSTSECEVVSGIDDFTNAEGFHQVNMCTGGGVAKEKMSRKKRTPTFHPHAKESRAKARARARERTMGKLSQKCQDATHHKLKRFKYSNSFEKGEESGSISYDVKSSMDGGADVETNSQQEPVNDRVAESFAIPHKVNQSSFFDFNHEIARSQGVSSSNFIFPNFSGYWDIDSTRTASTYSAVTNKNLSSGNAEEHIPTSFPLTTSETSFQSAYHCLFQV